MDDFGWKKRNSMMKIRKIIRYWRKAREAWNVIAYKAGWRLSFLEGRPVDEYGQPIPWYTYPAIEFIRSLDLKNCRVFEYGCGNSSMFWAKQAAEVFAVENDTGWAQKVRDLLIPNLVVFEAVDNEQYIQMPFEVGGTFDIVVVDGRNRRACAAIACRVVNQAGMIIFDNADWYPDACADLRSQGWFQVDFSGLGPINPYAWTTAVFLKTNALFKRNAIVMPTGGNPSGAV